MTSPCCRQLARAIGRPDFPLEYDASLCEYRLLLPTDGYGRMAYCPFCGSQFPESKRSSLELNPSEDEIAQIGELARIGDMAELRLRLGEPIEVVETDRMVQYRFANWNTVDLIVQKQKQNGAEICLIAVPKSADGQQTEGGGGTLGSGRE